MVWGTRGGKAAETPVVAALRCSAAGVYSNAVRLTHLENPVTGALCGSVELPIACRSYSSRMTRAPHGQN